MQTKIISELFRATSIIQTAACRIARHSGAGFTATPIQQRKQKLQRTQTASTLADISRSRRNFSIGLKQTSGSRKIMSKLTEQERGEKLEPLLKSGWSMVNGRDAIYKEYIFGDFNQAFSFMAGVALLAEKLNHHPEWFNVYNKVQVTMSTHDVGGLSVKDIRMATFMEEQSKRF